MQLRFIAAMEYTYRLLITVFYISAYDDSYKSELEVKHHRFTRLGGHFVRAV